MNPSSNRKVKKCRLSGLEKSECKPCVEEELRLAEQAVIKAARKWRNRWEIGAVGQWSKNGKILLDGADLSLVKAVDHLEKLSGKVKK